MLSRPVLTEYLLGMDEGPRKHVRGVEHAFAAFAVEMPRFWHSVPRKHGTQLIDAQLQKAQARPPLLALRGPNTAKMAKSLKSSQLSDDIFPYPHGWLARAGG